MNFSVTAQVYTGSGGTIITLVDTSRFTISVSGLSPTAVNYTHGLESVTISINHGSDRDIDCFLAAPDGTLIELTTDNGGTGNNYTNTVFSNTATTSITSGSAPFTGTYKPEGSLYQVNNGQNGNGTWELRVIDDSNNGTTGTLVNWKLTFGNSPASPLLGNGSNLPLVVINTNGQTVNDLNKIICDFGIISHGSGQRNYLTDPFNDFSGKVAIEYRGSSSQQFPKKGYGFEIRNSSGAVTVDTSLLGMPAESDWILNANYSDKTLMRNVLAYQLSREMGHYSTRAQYVELIINGEYQGVYILSEKIKRNRNRVNIAKLHPNETTYPDLSGGYIFIIDKTTGGNSSGWTSPFPPASHPNGQTIYYQYRYPSPDSISPPQEAYLQSYVDSFESALAGPNFRDSVLGYNHYISKKSFIDYFFVNEISKNVDGYRLSTFLYKDKLKPIHIGPVWDYDIAFGNANYCSGNSTTGWGYIFPCTGDGFQVPFWWQRMVQDTNFTNEIKCRWRNFRSTALSSSHLTSIVDSIAAYLNESKDRNFIQWPILGTYVWPNPSPYPTTYSGEVNNLKTWLNTRIAWLDANMPGNCSCNLTTQKIDVTCNAACDGQVIALGRSPYRKTYSWDNGSSGDTIRNLCPGNYVLSFEDEIGCTIQDTIVIGQPAVLAATVTSTNTVCTGNGCNGTASISTVGGTSPYSYNWSGGQTTASVSGLCSGSWTARVTDNKGCIDDVSVLIQNPVAPVVNLVMQRGTSCHAGSDGGAKVNVSGGQAPFTYSWSGSSNTTDSVSGLDAGTYTVSVTDANGCIATLNVIITQPPTLQAITTGTNLTCFQSGNGSASVLPGGGTAPYHYSWAPSGGNSSTANQLGAGNYSVTVTDNHACSIISTLTISQPSLLSSTTSTTDVSCYHGTDGSVSVSAFGGTAPYAYHWMPAGGSDSIATDLAAGFYIATVTDFNGCTTTHTTQIVEPADLLLSVSTTPANCGASTGSASVVPSGGTAPYTYQWSPSGGNASTANALSAGTYSVTVSDLHHCSETATAAVLSSAGISILISSQSNVSCFGGNNGSAAVQISGGTPPYVYAWSPSGGTGSSASALTAGTYTLSVSDALGCTNAMQVLITQPVQLSLTTFSGNLSCHGGSDGSVSVSAAGGTPAYSYLWSTIGSTGNTVSNLSAGNYPVLVYDVQGCSASAVVSITQPASIGISFSPVNATCGLANGSISALASGGTGAFHYVWTPGGSTASSLTGLDSGFYSLQITDVNGCSTSNSVHIGNSARPQLTLDQQSNVTCNGNHDGALLFRVGGGTRPFQFSWTPNISTDSFSTGLGAGIYKVIVTDQLGCHDSTGVILNEPAPVAVLMISNNVSCHGMQDGSIYASAGGGTPPYSYSWTPGMQMNDTATHLSVGNYSVLVTDQFGCTSSSSSSLAEPPALNTSVQVTGARCHETCDGSALIQASGGVQPYSVSWCDGNTDTLALGLCPGICQYTLTDGNGCVRSGQVLVVAPDSIQISVTHDNVSCHGCADGSASLSATGGTAPYTYLWSPGGQTTSFVNNLSASIYTACVSDFNQCMECVNINIEDSTIGIHELKGNDIIKIYPNPAHGNTGFYFELRSRQHVQLEILDLQGRMLRSIVDQDMESGMHVYRLDLHDMASGVYIIRFVSADGDYTGSLILDR